MWPVVPGEMKEASAKRMGNVLLESLAPEILETSKQGRSGGDGNGHGLHELPTRTWKLKFYPRCISVTELLMWIHSPMMHPCLLDWQFERVFHGSSSWVGNRGGNKVLLVIPQPFQFHGIWGLLAPVQKAN